MLRRPSTVLNYDALAACYYQQLYANSSERRRVGILDLDYHAGNGTYDIFRDRDDVMTISLHMDPAVDYPFYEGYDDEQGTGYHHHFSLPAGTDWPTYRSVLAVARVLIQHFQPHLLIVSFGGDTIRGDPEASPLGGMALELADYVSMGAFLSDVARQQDTLVI